MTDKEDTIGKADKDGPSAFNMAPFFFSSHVHVICRFTVVYSVLFPLFCFSFNFPPQCFNHLGLLAALLWLQREFFHESERSRMVQE